MLFAALAVVVGLVLLTKAADVFVEGAVRLAVVLSVSPVVIGAVVVGFGTSAPELLVSGLAAADGDLDLAVGNVIGSNIANLSLVLGLAAAIAAMTVDSSVLRREVPLTVAATLLFATVLVGGLSRLDGVVLLVALVGALAWLLLDARGSGNDELSTETVDEYATAETHRTSVEVLRTLAGLVGTVVGARLLITGAIDIAEEIGVSDAVIGLTLVAIGTSLPELVTAVVAARRGAHDLIIGNVFGSNLFNSLAVGGVAALVGPGPLAEADVAVRAAVVMLVVTGLAVAFVASGRAVTRLKGAALLGAYVVTVPLLAI